MAKKLTKKQLAEKAAKAKEAKDDELAPEPEDPMAM